MRRPKLSIGFAMVAIAIIGVGLFLLSRPTRLGVAIAFSFAGLCLVCSTIAAIYLRSRARAYWVGFAIGGWAYVALPLFASVTQMNMSLSGTAFFLPTVLLDGA